MLFTAISTPCCVPASAAYQNMPSSFVSLQLHIAPPKKMVKENQNVLKAHGMRMVARVAMRLLSI